MNDYIARNFNLLLDQKVPCHGYVTGWRVFASRTGTDYGSIWRQVGNDTFLLVGLTEINVDSLGLTVSFFLYVESKIGIYSPFTISWQLEW